MSSDRTPLARMLPSVIGSIGSLMRLAAIRRLYAGLLSSGKAAGVLLKDEARWMAVNFA
jgi:hypothetical protein